MDTTRKEDIDKLSIYLSLVTYLVAVIPYFIYSNTAIGMVCLVLSLWRFHLTYSNGIPPSINTTTIIGVLSVIILAGLTKLAIGPQYGIVALMVLIGCKNLSAMSKIQWTNNFVLLPFIPMGVFLTNDPVWSNGYLILFIWLWLASMWRVWESNNSLTLSMAKGSQLMLFIAPLVLISYFLIPRQQLQWNGHEQEASTGMSASLKPGDVGKLTQNNDTAFSVKFEDPSLLSSENMYWRGLVLSNYQNGEWKTSFSRSMELKVLPESSQIYRVNFPVKKDRFLYVLENGYIPGNLTDTNYVASIPKTYATQPFLQYSAVFSKKINYTNPPEHEVLPIENDNPKATELAISLKKDSTDVYTFIDNLRTYINKNDFVYSLEPGTMTDSWIDDFVFKKKRGFCEHYAGTVTYLLRQAGYPARVVVGFQGAQSLGSDGKQFIIPYSAAHAWLEFWDDKKKTWTRLDPTGWVAPDRLTQEHWLNKDAYKTGFMNNIFFFMESVDSKWKLWVTHYDADQQKLLINKIKDINWSYIVGVVIFLIFGMIVFMKKYYLIFSLKPKNQWLYLKYMYGMKSSSLLEDLEPALHDNKYFKNWKKHTELCLYNDNYKKKIMFLAWLKLFISIKSTSCINFIKNFKFI